MKNKYNKSVIFLLYSYNLITGLVRLPQRNKKKIPEEICLEHHNIGDLSLLKVKYAVNSTTMDAIYNFQGKKS